MFKCFTIIGVLCSICLCSGCSTANNKPVLINFNTDSTAIEITGINPAGLLQIQNSAAADATVAMDWIVVSNAGHKVDGDVSVKHNAVVFIPKVPLQRGQSYLVTTRLNASFGGAKEIAQGKISYQLKPQKRTLVR